MLHVFSVVVVPLVLQLLCLLDDALVVVWRQIRSATEAVHAALLFASLLLHLLQGTLLLRVAVLRQRLSLVLHAPVLEPDLDLPLGEVEAGGDLDAARPAQVLVEVKLLLELEKLGVGVGGPKSSREAILLYSSCEHTEKVKVSLGAGRRYADLYRKSDMADGTGDSGTVCDVIALILQP